MIGVFCHLILIILSDYILISSLKVISLHHSIPGLETRGHVLRFVSGLAHIVILDHSFGYAANSDVGNVVVIRILCSLLNVAVVFNSGLLVLKLDPLLITLNFLYNLPVSQLTGHGMLIFGSGRTIVFDHGI